jgi:hypothetical protein
MPCLGLPKHASDYNKKILSCISLPIVPDACFAHLRRPNPFRTFESHSRARDSFRRSITHISTPLGMMTRNERLPRVHWKLEHKWSIWSILEATRGDTLEFLEQNIIRKLKPQVFRLSCPYGHHFAILRSAGKSDLRSSKVEIEAVVGFGTTFPGEVKWDTQWREPSWKHQFRLFSFWLDLHKKRKEQGWVTWRSVARRAILDGKQDKKCIEE